MAKDVNIKENIDLIFTSHFDLTDNKIQDAHDFLFFQFLIFPVETSIN